MIISVKINKTLISLNIYKTIFITFITYIDSVLENTEIKIDVKTVNKEWTAVNK